MRAGSLCSSVNGATVFRRPIDWVTGNAWAIPSASKNKDQACTRALPTVLARSSA